jgi:hypothetical protein
VFWWVSISRPTASQGTGKFFDEERHTLGAVVDRCCEPVPWPGAQDPGCEIGGIHRAERFDSELTQAPAAPKFRAHAAQRMPARQLVAPVGTKDQGRRLLEHSVKVEQQLGRRSVHPLKIIEEHHHRLPARYLPEETADRLEQGRLIGVRRTWSELWEDEREVLGQGRPRQTIRDCTSVGADRFDNGRVRSNRPLIGGAAQHEALRFGQDGLH